MNNNLGDKNSMEADCDDIITMLQELKNRLLFGSTAETESLRLENMNLSIHNKELEEKVTAYRERLLQREQDIIQLNNQSKEDLYQKEWSETLEPMLKDLVAWKVTTKLVTKRKCSLCNQNRQIEYTSAHGDVKEHTCKDDYYEYIPTEMHLSEIRLAKTNKMKVSWEKTRNKEISQSIIYTDYDSQKCRLSLLGILENFTEDFANNESPYTLTNLILWKTREACQQCCDYLNKNSGILSVVREQS